MSKSYRQFCGLARALDVVGERWTLLVVRNLLLGPKRYGDLLAGLPGITTNLLAKRLHEMQDLGLVTRTNLPPPANVAVYELTPAGRELEPAVMELARWGGRFMNGPRKDDTVDLGWGLLSLKRRYLGGETLSVAIRADDRVFALELEPNYLRVEERGTPWPDLAIAGRVDAVRALFFLGPPTRDRFREHGLVLARGDEAALDRFLRSFAPPPVVPAPRPTTRRRAS